MNRHSRPAERSLRKKQFSAESRYSARSNSVAERERNEIGNLRPSETATALRRPIEFAGGHIDDNASTLAVDASMGQPYLVQMIGSYVWDDAEDLAREVTAEGVRRAVDDASRHCCQHVHGPVRHRLSNLDKRFLAWMLPDASTSTIAAVGGRWGHSARNLGACRQ